MEKECAVPENIHTPPTEGFWFAPLPLPKKFYLASYFASQILVFKASSPKEFLMNFHGVGMDFFWNCTICLPRKHLTSQELQPWPKGMGQRPPFSSKHN